MQGHTSGGRCLPRCRMLGSRIPMRLSHVLFRNCQPPFRTGVPCSFVSKMWTRTGRRCTSGQRERAFELSRRKGINADFLFVGFSFLLARARMCVRTRTSVCGLVRMRESTRVYARCRRRRQYIYLYINI